MRTEHEFALGSPFISCLALVWPSVTLQKCVLQTKLATTWNYFALPTWYSQLMSGRNASKVLRSQKEST